MDDTRPWWHNAEILKRSLAPFQKFKALAISLKLPLLVLSQRLWVTTEVHLDAVVNN